PYGVERAVPADEALHGPVGQHQRPVAGLGAGRPLRPHDRGQHVRLPPGPQLGGPLPHVARRGDRCRARAGAGAGHRHAEELAHVIARSVRKGRPWMDRHTFAGVSGMSACVIPYGASASTTALTTAAGEPTVADSPTPLAPIGW